MNWPTFTLAQMLDAQKELSVNAYWKNGFIPIGKSDMEGNWLVVDTSEGKKFHFLRKLGGKVLSWNTDDGVDECLDKNFGLYLEKFSNMLLGGKLEWDDSIGFISLG